MASKMFLDNQKYMQGGFVSQSKDVIFGSTPLSCRVVDPRVHVGNPRRRLVLHRLGWHEALSQQ
jgi:hypothetical protein